MNEEVIYYPEDGVRAAVEQFDTPFFLYEEKKLRSNLQTFRDSFVKYFPDFWPLYAVKANPNPEILKIVADEGFGADCSSESEAWICRKLGIEGMYTGNYTTRDEFKTVMGDDMIVNLDDISMIETVAELGMPELISFRINPGVGNGDFVTAGPDAKYGVPFEKASEAYKLAAEAGAKRFGIHMMTGSNVPISEENYFAELVEKLFEIVANVRDEAGIEIELMNIGGGFGVPYKPEEESLDMNKLAASIRSEFDKAVEKYGVKEPRLMAEPGRWIGANVGWLVSKVHVIKDSYKKFVGIDASSSDMPRPSIYGAYHYASVLDGSDRSLEEVSVVGRICENNDQFVKNRELPIMEVGDVVLIHNCGAHAFVMGHNYNGRVRHAECLLEENGELRMIRRAETIKELFQTTPL
ncbi:diaminopimelate decarboxylase [Candidatus Peregrinibacteria bacterium]|nr:diaminopimelate decarboxylase [Candidatus Peregrinibacteria bacterium]MBT7737024.1 diaminopimelate decarboxylase [Candidatus Peregrinibacteria bacterium]